MGSGSSKLAFAGRPPTVDPARRPPGLGQDDDRRQARAPAAQGGQAAGARRRRPPAPRRDRPARAARRADPDPGLQRRSAAIPSPAVNGGPRARARRGPRRRHPRHRRPAPRRRGADGGARRGAQREAKPHERAARPRRDDRPGGRQRRPGLPGAASTFDGVVLTKLDGDARGGAALSVKAVTGRPIKLASTGEKLDQLEYFHPDRMASRILGMGDVLTLIEKAEAGGRGGRAGGDGGADARGRVHVRRLPRGAARCCAEMGPLQGRPEDDPGLGKQLKGVDVDERQLGARRGDRALDDAAGAPAARTSSTGSRRRRIARGWGTTAAAGQPAAARAQADGEDDEADGQGQDAQLPTGDGMAPASARAARKEVEFTWQSA